MHSTVLRDECQLRSSEIVRSLSNAILFDPRRLSTEDGSLKRIQDLDDATADALMSIDLMEVKSADETVQVSARIRWASKHVAGDQAMRHREAYKRDNEQPIAWGDCRAIEDGANKDTVPAEIFQQVPCTYDTSRLDEVTFS